MSPLRPVAIRTSGYRGRRRLMDRITDEDLLFRFDPIEADTSSWSGTACASVTAEADTATEPHSVLTLGGEPVVVAIRPDPPAPVPAAFDDLPLFKAGCALEEEMADRLDHCRRNRRTLHQMYNLVADCETAPAVRPTPAEPVPEPEPVTTPVADPPRRRSSVLDLMDKKPARLGGPFHWRRFLVSVAVSGGQGSAALLLAYWIVY